MVDRLVAHWLERVRVLEPHWHRFCRTFPRMAEAIHFGGEVIRKYQKDDCLSYAAGLSFWLIVSLVPLTTLLFKMMAVVLGSKAYGPGTLKTLEQLLPYLPGEFLDDVLVNTRKIGGMGLSWGVLLFGGYWGLGQLDTSLSHVFGIRAKKHRQTRKHHFLRRMAILVGALLLLVVMMSLIVGGALRKVLPFKMAAFMPSLTLLAGLAVVTMVLQHLPRRHVRFKHAFLGALISTGLWGLAKEAFGVYLGHTMTWGIMYGSLVGIVAGLIFLYYSCAIFLLGAEITAAFYRHETGAHTIPGNLRVEDLKAF